MKIKKVKKRISRFLKKEKIFPWHTNRRKIELEITTECNLGCYNCDRSCRQAPSSESMSLQQIQTFIDESLQLNQGWINIAILGGEPTLHPHFFEVLDIFDKYKISNPGCRIELVTSGYGQRVVGILNKIPSWIEITNIKKKSHIQKFSTYNIAPIDTAEFVSSNFSLGCEITEYCGLGLTRYGYYPCGAGASVDRVFGFDIGLKKLSDCQPKKLKNQLKTLCKYCGHYKDRDMWNYNTETEEKISEIWQNTYRKYREKKPHLSLFGRK